MLGLYYNRSSRRWNDYQEKRQSVSESRFVIVRSQESPNARNFSFLSEEALISKGQSLVNLIIYGL